MRHAMKDYTVYTFAKDLLFGLIVGVMVYGICYYVGVR
jgi:hypothetical protein